MTELLELSDYKADIIRIIQEKRMDILQKNGKIEVSAKKLRYKEQSENFKTIKSQYPK